MSARAKVTKRADDFWRVEFELSDLPKYLQTAVRAAPFDIDHRRWWKGGVKPKRDSQRRKAYSAEDAALPMLEQERFSSLGEVARYLRDLISTEWFQRRWPEFRRVDLFYRPRKRSASANSFSNDSCTGGWINFGPWSLGNRPGRSNPERRGGEWLVLHELAHAIAPKGHHHDALWARIYLELVKFKMGAAAHDALRDEFRKKKVRYKPARQMTEAQRKAASERLTAVRAKANVPTKGGHHAP